MQCSHCRQQNPPQAKFCLECGARLVLTCAQCGTELPASAKFRFECGQPVRAQPTTPPQFTIPETYTHVEDADDPRAIQAKVSGHILTLDETLQDTIPALLALLDVLPDDHPYLKLDPPQRRQHTLNALKRVLLRESQVQPLLLVFEDLHWIDAETQTLVDP